MRRLARPVMYLGVFAVVLGLGHFHGRYAGDYDFVRTSRLPWSIAYAGLLCLGAYGLGLPEIPRTLRSRLPVSFAAIVLGTVGISLLQLAVGSPLLPRFVLFGGGALLVVWFHLTGAMAGHGRASSERRDRVLVVGSTELVEELIRELSADPERPATVVRHLSEDEARGSGEGAPLLAAAGESGATVLVLSGAAQADPDVVDQAAVLHESGVRVRTQSLFHEEWLGKIPVAELGRTALFFDIGQVHRERFGRVKRLVDLAAGLAGMVVLVLIVPAVLVGNVIANRGSLFYLQDRVGRSGRIFRIVKFRTMRADATAVTSWTTQDDPRVTPFGGFLRRTHLDELPQVWNIVRGDLSLVGPRPEQPRYVTELAESLPYYQLRHIVRPGLTGWAQVKYGYASDERDALEKLQYDFHYLRRQSVLFDLRIVARTIRAVVGRGGR